MEEHLLRNIVDKMKMKLLLIARDPWVNERGIAICGHYNMVD